MVGSASVEHQGTEHRDQWDDQRGEARVRAAPAVAVHFPAAPVAARDHEEERRQRDHAEARGGCMNGEGNRLAPPPPPVMQRGVGARVEHARTESLQERPAQRERERARRERE